MEVICLEDAALYQLFDKVVAHLKHQEARVENKWLTTEEAMKKLHITSKTTLQKLRDEGKIRFTHPHRRVILYDTDSLNEYLEKHTKETF